MRALRTVAVAVALVVLLVVPGLPAIIYTALGGDSRVVYRLGLFGAKVGLWIGGIVVRTHGSEHIARGKAYVFMANHQSHTDPPAVLTSIPRQLRVVLKQELGRVPILGQAMRQVGFVFVERGRLASARDSVDRAVELIRGGHSFMVFPEGTRSSDGRLVPFKSGGFVMALRAQAPILPITIVGSRECMPRGSWLIRPGVIDVYFHPAVETAGRSADDKAAVMAEVHKRIESVFGRRQ